MSAILYYFHDPMCSWCYAFQPAWQTIKSSLHGKVEVTYVLGGLAPDEDELMPESLQQTIQHHWQRIQQVVPGTEFNFDFWTVCEPRRSTYPACRAVIAATNQGSDSGERMTEAIQRAYYLEARNPSDYSTHIQLAEELDLDVQGFKSDLQSNETEQELIRQLQLTQSMNARGFPSLVLAIDGEQHGVAIDYVNPDVTLSLINELL
ncbi:MAG: DsbA family protein [Gammaproteobacteria bacterium]|jgi:putative protein-disulfide isomerase|nr:DsbA family protein [Gammaproteobacteria bacterium]